MWRCVVMLVAGCGRFGFDATPGDAQGDGPGDAQSDAAPLGMFGPATPVNELNTVSENDDPALSSDELEIFFTSGRSGGCSIWTSARTMIGAMWPPPTIAITTGSCTATAFISRDGLTAWLSIDIGNFELYESRRADRMSPWQTPTVIPGVNSAQQDIGPSVTADGLAMYFYSNRAGDEDLYVATRATDTASWSAPTRIDELATTAAEGSPHISPSGTELWFGSNRTGGNLGSLWVAKRATKLDPFGLPENVTELDSNEHEADPWVSDDGRRIYFTRFTGADARLFTASR